MHMGLQDKLQHFAAPDGTHVVGIDGPVTAEAVVDAHLAARAAGKRLTIVHAGAPTAVALRTAARFQATLVDAATIVPPAPEPEPLLAAPEPVLALPAHEDPPAAPVAPASPVAPPPSLLEEGTLPWIVAPVKEESFELDLDEDEYESMPWNVVHHQLLPAGRTSRLHHVRATTAPDWGLPWPRPQAPADGLAIADPKLWNAQQRIGAIREDLDRAGVPSFGTAKPEGSAWLKRLHEFGSP